LGCVADDTEFFGSFPVNAGHQAVGSHFFIEQQL
jgi:hypothetical protein